MPFFQGATDFEINGGNFYDVKGDQNNHRYDQSVKVDGEGNTLNYSPDFSRRDNRTFSKCYVLYTPFPTPIKEQTSIPATQICKLHTE